MTDLEPSPIEERRALFTPGQYTWPEPKLKRRCDSCDHFVQGGRAGKGSCRLVLDRHKMKGAQFEGQAAIACSQYKEPPRAV